MRQESANDAGKGMMQEPEERRKHKMVISHLVSNILEPKVYSSRDGQRIEKLKRAIKNLTGLRRQTEVQGPLSQNTWTPLPLTTLVCDPEKL